MSSVRAVKPHLHHLMIQLSRRRNGVSKRLPLLRLGPECAVADAVESPRIILPAPSTKDVHSDPSAPFGMPPSGWIPRKPLRRVLQMLHDEAAGGLIHANV